MTDQVQEVTEVTEVTPEPRAIVVDDVSYVVADLPEQLQQLITTYDVWVNDRALAQKEFSQKDSACRFLARSISEAVKVDAAAKKAKAKADAAEAETANAALDIPADDSSDDVEADDE